MFVVSVRGEVSRFITTEGQAFGHPPFSRPPVRPDGWLWGLTENQIPSSRVLPVDASPPSHPSFEI